MLSEVGLHNLKILKGRGGPPIVRESAFPRALPTAPSQESPQRVLPGQNLCGQALLPLESAHSLPAPLSAFIGAEARSSVASQAAWCPGPSRREIHRPGSEEIPALFPSPGRQTDLRLRGQKARAWTWAWTVLEVESAGGETPGPGRPAALRESTPPRGAGPGCPGATRRAELS